jgi:proline racemase
MTARSFRAVWTVDYHTGGEPFRIVAAPPVDLPGATVAERRLRAIGDPHADGLRKLLCLEPRGHADRYGGFITPPDDPGADLGVLFWHKDGFSTACGHGTIALGAWAVETGRVQAAADGATQVTIDVPLVASSPACTPRRAGSAPSTSSMSPAICWPRTSRSRPRGAGSGSTSASAAQSTPSCAPTPSAGGLPEHLNELLAIGREIKWLLNDSPHATHPSHDRLSGIYGTIVFDELGTTEDGSLHQRNVTIFADGQVDRSPCGSGSAARVAVLAARGDLGPGQALVHASIVGSTFTCTVVASLTADGHPAVIPQITGMAYRCGTSEFTLDPRDPFVAGFVLR